MSFLTGVIVTEPSMLAKGIKNTTVLHQFIMSLFPDSESPTPRSDWNIMWSVNPTPDPSILSFIVRSDIDPNLNNVRSDIAHVTTLMQMDPTIQQEGTLRIPINAHPNIKKYGIEKWFIKRCHDNGVKVRNVRTSKQLIVKGMRGSREVSYPEVVVLADYSIVDASLGYEFLRTGLGKAKSFGMGMFMTF